MRPGVEATFEEQRAGERKKDFMNNEMIEAARLTREGQLAEATALIRRSLMGSAPGGIRARFVDWPPVEVTLSSASEAPAPEPPAAVGAKIVEKPPAQPETGRRATLHRLAAPPFAPLDLTS